MKYRQIILLLPESVSRKCLSVEFCSRTRTEVTVHRLHPVQVFILSLWVSCLLLQQDARRRQFIDRKAAFDSQLETDPSWWGCMVAGVWCSLSHRSQQQEAEGWGLMLGLFSPLFQSRTPAHGMVPPIVRRGGGSSHLSKPCRESNAQMCQLACLPGDSRRLPSEQSLLTITVSSRLLRGRVQSQERH